MNINQYVEECCVGEFSNSTVKQFIKDALYEFGEQCFDAGGEMLNYSFKYKTFEDYLKTLEDENM